MDRSFEAPDLIEILGEAVNYNRFLTHEVSAWSGGLGCVLDFGAGNGRLAGALHDQGRNVRALEPDARLRSEIHARGIDTIDDLAGVPSGSCDGVYSINVLEHIPDDESIVREFRRILRPGGSLFLYVPAFPILFSANDRRVGHVRRYRLRSLVGLLERNGFAISRAEYVDVLGFPSALAYRAIGSRDGDLNVRTIKFYDRVLFPLSRRIDSLTKTLVGKNLLVVGTRKAD